jgi:hypothetical protein
MEFSRLVRVSMIAAAAALYGGCGGCQDEAPAPQAAPTAAAPAGEPAAGAPAAAPEAAKPEAAKPEGAAATEDMETELIVWASSEPDSGPAPLSVTFTVESLEEGFIDATFEWDFGDGSPVSKEAGPTHTYEKPGEYTARVKITQADGQKGHDETWIEVE